MADRRTNNSKPDPRGIIGQISRIRERANLLIEQELATRSIEGILPAHGAVLVCLFRRSGPMPTKEIVDSVGRVKSTVTGMLNTLEKNGYVKRKPDEVDSRAKLIELTQKGEALRDHFEAISKKLNLEVYKDISIENQQKLATLLAQLEKNLSGVKEASKKFKEK